MKRIYICHKNYNSGMFDPPEKCNWHKGTRCCYIEPCDAEEYVPRKEYDKLRGKLKGK